MGISKFEEIERREGQPMRSILKKAYAKHGNQTGVAKSLGVSQGSLSLWLKKLGMQQKTILVPRSQK